MPLPGQREVQERMALLNPFEESCSNSTSALDGPWSGVQWRTARSIQGRNRFSKSARPLVNHTGVNCSDFESESLDSKGSSTSKYRITVARARGAPARTWCLPRPTFRSARKSNMVHYWILAQWAPQYLRGLQEKVHIPQGPFGSTCFSVGSLCWYRVPIPHDDVTILSKIWQEVLNARPRSADRRPMLGLAQRSQGGWGRLRTEAQPFPHLRQAHAIHG
jgi:hypothetical protein